MSGESNGFQGWIDQRFPMSKLWREHVAEYYAPKNFNFWYFFGSLALLVLVNQIVTGIFLTMFYDPSAQNAFGSVAHIMRDVQWGWLIRYMHSTGASLFFVVVYLHMFRALLYGSYRKPRELLWIFGMLIFLVLMAEAFMGYVLPWGNMSRWGAQVITSLFGVVPGIGNALVSWVRGGFSVGGPTLHRLFALHVAAVPLLLVGLVVAHLMALHEVGSNNPEGIEIKKQKDENGIPLDGIPFHPYYTVKDLFGVGVFLIIFFAIVFFAPTMDGHFLEVANFTPASALKTPPHIEPSWYFTPYYAILRAVTINFFGVPAKTWGVVALALSVLFPFLLPWLDRSPAKSIRYRGWMFKLALSLFVISFLALGWLGMQPPLALYRRISVIFLILYFAFFLLMPFYSRWDKTKAVPERIETK